MNSEQEVRVARAYPKKGEDRNSGELSTEVDGVFAVDRALMNRERRAMGSESELEDAHRAVSISVRDLVSFVWRDGGLGRSSERSLPNRAVRGTRGHQELQRKRPSNYVPEVSIRHGHCQNDIRLSVYGRIDGIFEGEDPLEVEEIKTVTRLWDGQVDPLHRTQLRFYAAVLARRRDLGVVSTRLTYYNLDTRAVKSFEQTEERSALERFLNQTH